MVRSYGKGSYERGTPIAGTLDDSRARSVAANLGRDLDFSSAAAPRLKGTHAKGGSCRGKEQGYLAHKKYPPDQDYHRFLSIWLM